MYKKILLGMDQSENAERAAKTVLGLQQPGVTKIVAFHSIGHHMIPARISLATPIGGSYALPAVDYSRIRDDYREAGRKILSETEQMFKGANVEIETRLIENFNPEEYIETATKEENFDLVVLGCKGQHSKLEEIFAGSIAEKAKNNAACDVLLVR